MQYAMHEYGTTTPSEKTTEGQGPGKDVFSSASSRGLKNKGKGEEDGSFQFLRL
jgi:hypothetical protein